MQDEQHVRRQPIPAEVIDESLLEAWRRTVLRIRVPAPRGFQFVEVTPSKTTDGPFPNDRPIYLVTAHNPGGLAQRKDDNDERQQQLLREVAGRGLTSWSGLGLHPNGEWAEKSVALANASLAVSLELGRRFDQLAIFEWANQARGLRIISCVSGRVLSRSSWTSRIS